MKKAIVAMILLMVGAGTLQAKEQVSSGYTQVVRAWMEDRDQAVQQIFYGFLRGAKPESLQDAYARLVVLDTKLANEDVFLYVTGLTDAGDLNRCIRDVVRIYLQRQGINFDAADFFKGKSYEIIRE